MMVLDKLISYLHQQHWAQFFILGTRYLIGAGFAFAGTVKVQGLRFTGWNGENDPIDTLGHFFETMYRSGLYWQFIGWAQVVAAFLLLTQRYARLGAVIFYPIILNIFVITVAYGFTGTPVITGLMLLANTALLVWEWDALKVLLGLPATVQPGKLWMDDVVWQWLGLALFVLAVGMRSASNGYDFMLWMGGNLLVGMVGVGVGLYRRRRYRTLSQS